MRPGSETTATAKIWGRIAGASLPAKGQRNEASGRTATAYFWRTSGDDCQREYLGEDCRSVLP